MASSGRPNGSGPLRIVEDSEPEGGPRAQAAPATRMRQTRVDDERDRLLTAAMQVLQRSGWWGFKVESVLKQAGLSTRSFYRHFEKKSDLLLALLEVELGKAAVGLAVKTSQADSPSGKVRAYIAAIIDMAYVEDLVKPSSLFASHWRELLPEYPEAIDRCTENLIVPLADAIEAGTATGEFTSEHPLSDARAIFYLVFSITADQATLGGSTPRAEIEQLVLPFVSRAIGLR